MNFEATKANGPPQFLARLPNKFRVNVEKVFIHVRNSDPDIPRALWDFS
jgi:hypothetical protein